MTTDASFHGWGAYLPRQSVKGTWPPSWSRERSRHINELEMRAILLGIRHWPNVLAGKSVQLLVDNMTTVHYLKKEGGTKSAIMTRLTKQEDLTEYGIVFCGKCYKQSMNDIILNRVSSNTKDFCLSEKHFFYNGGGLKAQSVINNQ